MLLLPRELLLFDTQLGAPAASTVLPKAMAPLRTLLGIFGSGVCVGGGDDGGVDFLYALHTGAWQLGVWLVGRQADRRKHGLPVWLWMPDYLDCFVLKEASSRNNNDITTR